MRSTVKKIIAVAALGTAMAVVPALPAMADTGVGFNGGILNGTQLYAPIDLPVNVCGNSLALLGSVSVGNC